MAQCRFLCIFILLYPIASNIVANYSPTHTLVSGTSFFDMWHYSPQGSNADHEAEISVQNLHVPKKSQRSTLWTQAGGSERKWKQMWRKQPSWVGRNRTGVGRPQAVKHGERNEKSSHLPATKGTSPNISPQTQI